jgi:hypothetical protein
MDLKCCSTLINLTTINKFWARLHEIDSIDEKTFINQSQFICLREIIGTDNARYSYRTRHHRNVSIFYLIKIKSHFIADCLI